MASTALKYMTIGPTSKHTASVIFLHGLGDSSKGWAPVATMLSKNPSLSHVKFILPDAPVAPVTLNFGYRMPSWFDIKSLDEEGTLAESGEDREGMLASSYGVNKIITEEVDAEIKSSRIIVGGFSQGGAIGLLTGLTSERKLGGIVALSTWLPMSSKMPSMMTDAARNIPIFFGHSKDDPVVQYSWGLKSFEALKKPPFNFPEAAEGETKSLTWKAYDDMGHGSSIEEINDLTGWLQKVIPATGEGSTP